MRIAIAIALLLIGGIQCCKTTEFSNTDVLVNEWRVSHEEGGDEMIVLRPSSYNFPPSRFREGYSFEKDNGLTLITFGPADAPVRKNGNWHWQNDNILMLIMENSDTVYWEVVEMRLDKIVVRKMAGN